MFNKKRKQEKVNKEQEEEILRFLRNKEIKKLLFNLENNEVRIIPLKEANSIIHNKKTISSYEKDLIFDWNNDIDLNKDFNLWEREFDERNK